MPASSEASGAPGDGFTSISAPSPLRLSGFLATALGAAMLGIGSVLTWVTLSVGGFTSLNGVYKGLDLTQGKLCLAAAIVLLVGLMALRGARSPKAQRVIATVMIVAALLGLAFAGSAILSSFASIRGPGDALHRGIGMFLAAAGGVVASIGAVLDLAWAVAPEAGSAAPGPDADGRDEGEDPDAEA